MGSRVSRTLSENRHEPNIDDKVENAIFLNKGNEDKHEHELKKNKEDNSEKCKEEKESEEESVKNEKDEAGKQKKKDISTGVQVSNVKTIEKKTVSWSDTGTVRTDDEIISLKQPITPDACTSMKSENEVQENRGEKFAHVSDSYEMFLKKEKNDEQTGVQVSNEKPKEKKTVSWSDTVTVKTDDGTISKKQPLTCDACTAISTEFIQKNIFKDDSNKNKGKSESSKEQESENEPQETSGKSLAHTCDSFDLARSRIPLIKDKDEEKEDKE